MGLPCYTLITGASSGIGRGIAVELSKRRNLILNGRNEARLGQSIEACGGFDRHLAWARDLSDPLDLGCDFASFLERRGAKVDCFVHSAGIVEVNPTRLSSLDAAQRMMNVNFLSALEILKALLKKAVNGDALNCVLFISSIHSKQGAKGQSVYCATKGAIDSFAKALSIELAPKVRVNSLLPGGVRTPMVEAVSSKEYIEKTSQSYPLGLGTVEDIAAYAEFIISDRARWLTGQNIVMDGGFSA
jgi:NAD(P)-dependent dehydrogenase (short-subunit alcohol dehydrogenase family)